VDPTQSQRLQYTSSSTFRKPDKPSPATAVDFMYDSGKNHYENKLRYYDLRIKHEILIRGTTGGPPLGNQLGTTSLKMISMIINDH